MERVEEKPPLFGNTEAAVMWTRDQFAASPNLSDRQKKKIAKKFEKWKDNPEPVISLYLEMFNECRQHIGYVMQSSHLPTFKIEAVRESAMYKKMVFWGALYDLSVYKRTFNGKRYCDISDRDLESYESVLFRVEYALRDAGLEYESLGSVQKVHVLNRYYEYAFLHEATTKKKKR